MPDTPPSRRHFLASGAALAAASTLEAQTRQPAIAAEPVQPAPRTGTAPIRILTTTAFEAHEIRRHLRQAHRVGGELRAQLGGLVVEPLATRRRGRTEVHRAALLGEQVIAGGADLETVLPSDLHELGLNAIERARVREVLACVGPRHEVLRERGPDHLGAWLRVLARHLDVRVLVRAPMPDRRAEALRGLQSDRRAVAVVPPAVRQRLARIRNNQEPKRTGSSHRASDR